MFITSLIRKFFLVRGYEINKIDTRKNLYYGRRRWEYQEPFVKSHLPSNGIILDIGSGHFPTPGASILADFFPEDTIHRGGTIVEDRPLVVCSVERMPFRNKKFDFVVCSHVLEHLDHPARAAQELSRIAGAGYIETPAYGKDIIVGTGNMHKWQVVEFEGTMHFFEYSQRQFEAHVTSPAMELWASKKYHPWQDFFWKRQDLYNAMHIWKDSPSVIEHRRNITAETPLPGWAPVSETALPDSPVLLSDKEIDMLLNTLSTPDGKEGMLFDRDKFVSSNGNIRYPVRGKRIYFELSQ